MGSGGSGKSYLIKAIVKAVRLFFKENDSVQVVCPTSSAANLIDGCTLHSFFKIATRKHDLIKELKAPHGCRGAQLQENCKNLVVLMIDERSMVGATNWGWMEHNCSFGVSTRFNHSNASWGGLPIVIALGDDIQFPPVCDSAVFNNKSKAPAAIRGTIIWQEFSTVVHLTQIVRQSADQSHFKDILTTLRTYSLSKEQAQWLQNFQWCHLEKQWKNLTQRMEAQGLYIFPRHKQVWEHNKHGLLQLNSTNPIAKICSQDNGRHNKVPADQAQGLQPILWLCKGAKVMLSLNLITHLGLFHRSTGIIKDIIYSNGNMPPQLPQVVMVEFHKYTGTLFIQNNPKIVPIIPVERQMECCNYCKRKQIPLRLAWATTVHGCQGMTVGPSEQDRYIIMDPGDKKFESTCPGSLYVALSRGKTAGTDTTDPDFAFHKDVILNEDRLMHVVNTPTTRARYSEINRLLHLADTTKKDHKYSHTEETFQGLLQSIMANEIPQEE